MPHRNLVLCSDGTGNRAGKANGTNVWKLYEALDRQGPDGVVQLAVHDDGVGTSKYKPLAVAGGAFGYGLARNLRQLYLWLAKNYRPGDRIYMFGFSRGAFTVRCLAGMVTTCGVLDPGRVAAEHPEQSPAEALQARVLDAWVAYRASRHEMGAAAADLRARYGAAARPGSDDRHVRVRVVGVWDTVDAYGLPADELVDLLHRASEPVARLGVRLTHSRWGRDLGRRLILATPTSFRDNKLSPLVERGLHAIAIDDERKTFHPELWDLRGETRPERIEQVWFAGMHSDVGGGYARDSLALVSLKWMMERAGTGDDPLRFDDDRRRALEAAANELGPMHDSRSGLGVYYRYAPRDAHALAARFDVPVVVHGSVLDRIAATRGDGAPGLLPEDFQVAGPSRQPDLRPQPELRPAIERVVALRRRVYRGFLLVTALALALPLLLKGWTGGWPEPRWGLLAHVFALADRWLPAFAAEWVSHLRRLPLVVLGLSLAAYVLMRARARLLDYEDDAVRRMWGQAPLPPGGCPAREVPGLDPWRDALRFAALALALAVVSGGLQDLLSGVLPADALEARAFPVHRPLEDGASRTWLVPASDPDFAIDRLLLAGQTYRVSLSVAQPLADRGLAAGTAGLTPPVPLRMALATPLRREPARPWMAPLAALGSVGARPFPLADGASFTAERDGRLHVFVNDAVCYLCPDPWAFYRNNTGVLRLTLTHVPERGAP